MNQMARTLALRGLRRRYSTAPVSEVQRYLVEQRLGADLAVRVYGSVSRPGNTDDQRAG